MEIFLLALLIGLMVLQDALLTPKKGRPTPLTAEEVRSMLEANYSDEDLTKLVPLVVEGVVLSREEVSVLDHPQTSALSLSDKKELEGQRILKWRVRVERVIKGDSPAEISVVRGVSGDGVHVFGGGQPHVETVSYGTITEGTKHRFWLEPDRLLEQNHWILDRAKPV